MPPILFFSFPAHGHVNPTLPVVAELVRRGEQVAYFATARFRKAVEGSGARFFPYPAGLEIPEEEPGPFDRIATTLDALLRMSDAVLEEQLDQVGALDPALIVHDSFSPWGRFVAQRLALPAMVSAPSILVNQEIVSSYGANPDSRASDSGLTREWFERMDSLCSAFAARHRVTRRAPDQWLQVYGDLNLVYTSRLFQPRAEMFDSERFRFVGPSIGRRAEAPAFPFHLLGREPWVYISLGTVYGDRGRFFPMCVEAFRNSPWRIVMAVGRKFQAPAPVPGNFIIEPSVPQIEILEHAAAFVTHGGMNSVNEALYFNVPLVVAPQGADQFWIASRVAELGAGIVLGRGADASDLREAVERVLADRRYSQAAARIGESLRNAGGYRKAADEILAFRGAR